MNTRRESRPIVDQWFERRRASPSITLLFEPHVDPFMRANIWHVRGRDRDLLFDAGLGISSLRDFALDLFDRPIVAVASHSHFDHVGGLREFETVVAHPLDAELMRRRQFASLLASDYPGALRDEMSTEGDELVTAYPSANFDPAAYAVQPVEPTRLVEDGDVIDLGDRAFVALHLPGHTPGSIALWEAETGVLFSGDVIYDGHLLDELRGSDIGDYVSSMERLRVLPVSAVHAGHFGSFGRERFVELVDDYLHWRR